MIFSMAVRLLLPVVGLMCACAGAQTGDRALGATVERHVVAMGTSLRLTVTGADRTAALRASEAAVRAVEATEQRLSTWRADSELARFAAVPVGELFPASAELRGELRRAARWRDATQGAFDVDLGELLAIYDLRGAGRWPSERELAAVMRRRADPPVTIGARGLQKQRGVAFDAGGFGTGAGLDAAAAAALASGASAAEFDFGGQLHLAGDVCARDVELADPRDRTRRVLRVRVAGGSVATTANSERRRSVGGRALGHVLDPRTGAPAADFGAVTVFASSAFDADCLSTACYVLGPANALLLAERTAGVELVVLEMTAAGELRVRASSGLRGRVEPLLSGISVQ